MSLYARSDLMSVSIPSTSGGCGTTHSRPVTKGAAAKVWELSCPLCESYLRGDKKPKVIKVTGGDKNKGIPSRMEHVADADPHWANAPEAVPQTPDEEKIHSKRAEIGSHQLQMLEQFAAAIQAGLDIPKEAWWLLEQNFDTRLLKGKLVCVNGHENHAGAKFCVDCGVNMSTRGAVEKPEETTALKHLDNDLSHLSLKDLRLMCKQENLPTSGSKAQLMERLS